MVAEHPAVGTHIVYPREKGWHAACEIPELVALEWLIQVIPDEIISGDGKNTAAQVKAGSESRWTNKMAYVVESNGRTNGDLALYREDNLYFVMRMS